MPYDAEDLLVESLSDLFTTDQIALFQWVPQSLVDQYFGNIYYRDVQAWTDAATNAVYQLNLALPVQLTVRPLGSDILVFVLGSSGQGWTTFLANVVVGPDQSITLINFPLAAQVSKDLLQPMLDVKTPDPTALCTTIDFGSVSLMLSLDNVSVDAEADISLPLCMIGSTGVVIEATTVQWLGTGDTQPGAAPSGYSGVYMNGVRVHLPDLDFLPDDVLIDGCYVNETGLTCDASISFNVVHDTSAIQSGEVVLNLFGWQAALAGIEAHILQNVPTSFDVTGFIKPSFLSSLLQVEFGLQQVPGASNYQLALSLSSLAAATVDLNSEGLALGSLQYSSLSVTGSIQDNAFALDGSILGFQLKNDFLQMSASSATFHVKHQPTSDELSLDLQNVPFGALGKVDSAQFKTTWTTDTSGKITQTVHLECQLEWSDISGRLQLPSGFPAPVDSGTVSCRLDWTKNASTGKTQLVLSFSAELQNPSQLWSFVPAKYSPQVRKFELNANVTYNNAGDFTSAATTGTIKGSSGTTIAVSADIEFQLPDLPANPQTNLLQIDTGDPDGWIAATATFGERSSGQFYFTLTLANPLGIKVALPWDPQAEPPITLQFTGITAGITPGTTTQGFFDITGSFALDPIVPPVELPIAGDLENLFKGIQTSNLVGTTSAKLSFNGSKVEFDVDAEFTNASVSFDVLSFLENITEGLGVVGDATVSQIPVDSPIDFTFKAVKFQLGNLSASPAAASVSFQLVTDFSFGSLSAECALSLSDREFSLGLVKVDIPLQLPPFPLVSSDMAGLFHAQDSAWVQLLRIWQQEINLLASTTNPAEIKTRDTWIIREQLVRYIEDIRKLLSDQASRDRFDDATKALLQVLSLPSGLTSANSGLTLSLRNIVIKVPFYNTRNIGVSGTAQLTGFSSSDPFKAIGDVILTLGLSSDLIYFGLSIANPIPLPTFGRYPGGSVNISKFLVGFGYTKRSLSVAIEGALVLPPQLIADANTSGSLGAGIILPHQSQLQFRFDLIPVPVIVVVPSFELNLDLRDTYSPGLVESVDCAPYWDGLEVNVKDVLRIALKQFSISPMFGPFPAINENFSATFSFGNAKNGATLICDEIFWCPGIMVNQSLVPIPFILDGVPYFENCCQNFRLAGFELNIDVQRPTPSFNPLALFEIVGLLSDPNMPVNPTGALASSVSISLDHFRFKLPPEVQPLFPWTASVVNMDVSYTVNLGTAITAAQHLGALLKSAVQTIKAASGNFDSIVSALAHNSPQVDLAILLSMVPPDLRRQTMRASFAGFEGSATVALIDRNAALAELAGATAQLLKRPGNAVPTNFTPFPAIPQAPNPFQGSVDPQRLSPAYASVLGVPEFSGFTAVDLRAIPMPEGNPTCVLVAAELGILNEHYGFLGLIFDTGAFALVSSMSVAPLVLSVAGISVTVPFSLASRLVIVGSPTRNGIRGVLQVTGWCEWNVIPGILLLKIANSKLPAKLTLQSDGRFALTATVTAQFFSGAATFGGTVDLSDAHCLVTGSLYYTVPGLISLTATASGSVGPGPHFHLQGQASLSVLNQPLINVTATADEQSVEVQGQWQLSNWAVGPVSLPFTLSATLAGQIDLSSGQAPSFMISGGATASFPGIGDAAGVQLDGEIELQCESGTLTTTVSGDVTWLGHKWVSGSLVLSPTSVALNGKTDLYFELGPSNVGGIELANIVLKVSVDCSFSFDGNLELASYSISGDAILGLQLPGNSQIFPIAMASFGPAADTTKQFAIQILNMAGLGPLSGGIPINLPTPSVSFGSESNYSVPTGLSFDAGSVDFWRAKWTPPSLKFTNSTISLPDNWTPNVTWGDTQITLPGLGIPSATVYLGWTGNGFAITFQ